MLEILKTLEEMECWAASLFQDKKLTDDVNQGWIPIGLALWATSKLYRLLLQNPESQQLTQLFDGGELQGPNLDTRLKYIRDLCGASSYFFKRHCEETAETSVGPIEAVQTPGESAWSALISSYIRSQETIQEVSRLLDDVLEAMLCIYQNLLLIQDRREGAILDEVHRHLTHIADHFDYAEEMVIEAMNPAED